MPRNAYFKHMIWGTGMSLLAIGFSAQASANGYGANAAYSQSYPSQAQAYGGGAYGGGDIYGASAYGAQSGCQGSTGFQSGQQTIKSRYGVWQEAQVTCQMGGYWVYPQQYVAETPIIQHRIVEETPVQAPIPAPAPIVVTQDCPVGQYWRHDGHCAALKVEPVRETYVPPLSSYSPPQAYPEPATPLPSYVLPRK